MLGREQRLVLCIFGVVLVCLHTFTVVKTSPSGRRLSSSLQRSLKRNLTILAKAFNVTEEFADSPKRNKGKSQCSKGKGTSTVSLNSGIDLTLVNAPATNTRKVKLISRYGYFLQLANDGSVRGTMDDKSLTIRFEIQVVCVGVVRIKSIATGQYLAMDDRGRLRGRDRRSLETLFETQQVDTYHWYRSYVCKAWYIGIRKNGSQKPAHLTAMNQKAVLFLVDSVVD